MSPARLPTSPSRPAARTAVCPSTSFRNEDTGLSAFRKAPRDTPRNFSISSKNCPGHLVLRRCDLNEKLPPGTDATPTLLRPRCPSGNRSAGATPGDQLPPHSCRLSGRTIETQRPPVSRVLQNVRSARAIPHSPSTNDDSPPRVPGVRPPDDPADFPFWRSARTTRQTPALWTPPPARPAPPSVVQPGRMGPLPMRSHSSPTPVFEQIFSMTSTLGRFSFRS